MSLFRFATLSCVAFVFVATFNASRMLSPIGRELSNTGNGGPSQLRAPPTATVDQPRPTQLEYVASAATNAENPQPPPAPVNPTQLEFVHIPKTGGTAIEFAASLANITWGLCHWRARPLAGPGCHHPDWAGYNSRENLSGQEIDWEHWHVPPRHQTSLQSPYKNKTLFAVVRNPYERFISEFYCPYTGWNPVDWTQEDLGFFDPMGKPLEDALQDALRKAADGEPTEPQVKKPETPNALNYFLIQRLQWFVKWTAHYLPQSDYVYDKDGTRIVDHVLKYEELREEFADLMDHYDLPVYLNSTVNQRNDKKRVRLTVMDLFPETIQRINDVARKDFLNFGYSMIDPTRLALQRAAERKVQRVYYINLLKNTQRRDLMESWLRLQPIPYERINATIGSSNPQDCVAAKQHLDRCRGLSGLAKTELDIIRNHNTSGLTLVFEDDFVAYEPLDEIVERTLKMVPSDWDVIRWDCWGEPSDLFDVLSPGKVYRTYANVTSRNRPGWYCGGTHAMLWREESISKLEQLWSREPFDDIDCRLTTESLNSYCVNIGIGGLEKLTVERSDIPKIDSSF